MLLAAAVQLSSTADVSLNLAHAERWVREAARRGASLIVTPENTNFLGPHRAKVAAAEDLDGLTCSRFAELAAELRVTLVLGSFNERSDDPQRCYNTSVVFGPNGDRLATYRKIHLFDVDVDAALRFRESDTVVPGTDPVVVETPAGRLGLSICYDLRFGELYRALVDQGADILLVPSAFTLTTGRDHWHPLLAARAIENQAYVIAANQVGAHDDEGLRASYGHSCVLDAWGHRIALQPDAPGIALAPIDPASIADVRRRIPVAAHRRLGRPC
jgi:predicted amidohydrolase